MLTLTRNIGERIFIDGSLIAISVEQVRGGQVRIGIEAPKTISVHREEVYERIQEEETKKADKRAKSASLKLSKGHILLVEDNAILQKVHSNFLGKLGYTVDIAENGEQALKMSKNSYALILMDLGLPDISGVEVIKAIRNRKKQKDIPILVLTAFDASVMKQQCIDVGANGFENKPLSIQKLDQSMEEILNPVVQ